MSRSKAFPYIFILPSVLLFAVFILYPIISSLVLSFQTSDGGELSFAGLANYERLLHDEIFWKALKNTFIIFIFQVPIMLFLGLVLATVLNNKLLKWKGFFSSWFLFASGDFACGVFFAIFDYVARFRFN